MKIPAKSGGLGLSKEIMCWVSKSTKNHTLNIVGIFLHPIPPLPQLQENVAVAWISHEIRFAYIKLTQIFTVKHVLRYGQKVYGFQQQKTEILNKKLVWHQNPPTLRTLSQVFFLHFFSDSSPEEEGCHVRHKDTKGKL